MTLTPTRALAYEIAAPRRNPLRISFMLKKLFLVLLVLLAPLVGICAAQDPVPTQGDFVLRNFRFTSGEMLPELRVHYRTLGTPQRDAQGVVRNAVLILH